MGQALPSPELSTGVSQPPLPVPGSPGQGRGSLPSPIVPLPGAGAAQRLIGTSQSWPQPTVTQ